MSEPEKSPASGRSRPWWVNALALAAAGSVVFAAYTLVQRGSQQKSAPAEQDVAADAGVITDLVGAAIVSDGDTIRIGPRQIRFDGIDAPAQGGRCGDVNMYRASGNALRALTDSGVVRCRISDLPDTKGRDMAQCTIGDIDINEYMVANGWARDWPLHSDGAYADEEATARAAQRGIWAPNCTGDMWGNRDYSNPRR